MLLYLPVTPRNKYRMPAVSNYSPKETPSYNRKENNKRYECVWEIS